MKRAIAAICLLSAGLTIHAQDWEAVTHDSSVLWAEGYGRSVTEADAEAVRALAARVTMDVSSTYRQEDVQTAGNNGTDWTSTQLSRISVASGAILPSTHRIVLHGGRKAHVGLWIRQEEVDKVMESRKARILDYESLALQAEQSLDLDAAMKYHLWAYVLLRSMQYPSEVRNEDGSILLNRIPEEEGDIIDDIRVSWKARYGDNIDLCFTYHGYRVKALHFSYFDGSRWRGDCSVSDGHAVITMAHGALAEHIQIRISSTGKGDPSLDSELAAMLAASDLMALGKKQLIVGR